MPITVIVPNALRPYAGGMDRVPIDAQTAGEAIQKLVERYTHLQGHLPVSGQLGEAIYRNRTALHKLQGLETQLRDGDRLTLIVPEGDL